MTTCLHEKQYIKCQPESAETASGKVTWFSHPGNSLAISLKTECETTTQSNNCILGIYPRERKFMLTQIPGHECLQKHFCNSRNLEITQMSSNRWEADRSCTPPHEGPRTALGTAATLSLRRGMLSEDRQYTLCDPIQTLLLTGPEHGGGLPSQLWGAWEGCRGGAAGTMLSVSAQAQCRPPGREAVLWLCQALPLCEQGSGPWALPVLCLFPGSSNLFIVAKYATENLPS